MTDAARLAKLRKWAQADVPFDRESEQWLLAQYDALAAAVALADAAWAKCCEKFTLFLNTEKRTLTFQANDAVALINAIGAVTDALRVAAVAAQERKP